jgi:hypothetical protein
MRPELGQLTPRKQEKCIGMTSLHAQLAPLPLAFTDPLHYQQQIRGTRYITATNSKLERFLEGICQASMSVGDPGGVRRLRGEFGYFLPRKVG